jgi:hypothetical protein
VTFWCGSRSGSAGPYGLQDANKKLFFVNNFLLLLFDGTFTSFFRERVKKSYKIIGNKVFLLIFYPYLEPEQDPEPDPYLCLLDPDPGGPKTCGSGGSRSAALVASVSRISS